MAKKDKTCTRCEYHTISDGYAWKKFDVCRVGCATVVREKRTPRVRPQDCIDHDLYRERKRDRPLVNYTCPLCGKQEQKKAMSDLDLLSENIIRTCGTCHSVYRKARADKCDPFLSCPTCHQPYEDQYPDNQRVPIVCNRCGCKYIPRIRAKE